MLKTEAIRHYLQGKTDLAHLYDPDMEVQVNVARDDGEKVEGEYKGRKWNGWTDNLTTWKSFRIPYNAASDPTYEDTELRFSLSHAEGIGMTGWNWKKRESHYVAFDFDSIANHKGGISDIDKVKEMAKRLPYVTTISSTSGKGLHLYIFLKDHVRTENHNEHAALARSILSKMCADTGYDFQSKVDVCGGNMWVWHRKKTEEGLKVLKHGEAFDAVPTNWRDHIKVVSKTRTKIKPTFLPDEDEQEFDSLMGQRYRVPLDGEHRAIIEALSDTHYWWDQDHHMLVCHTYDLKEIHKRLKLRGIFDTISTGKDRGNDHNCFCFPLRGGGWVVRRYSKGTGESECWYPDSNGWTKTLYNVEPSISISCKSHGATEHSDGSYHFRSAELARNAALACGVPVDIPPNTLHREVRIKEHKDGRLIFEIDKQSADEPWPGWYETKDKKFGRIFDMKQSKGEEESYDDLVRHVITESDGDNGWFLNIGKWVQEPLQHIKSGLPVSAKQREKIIGNSIRNPWVLVNRPFMPEYTGNREWNRGAAQFRFTPKPYGENLNFGTWKSILDHCGNGLNEAILDNEWCRSNGITTGGAYLKCWCASMFQKPTEPLPYLFFYGDQNTGKSMFHEALRLLFKGGYVRAYTALTSPSGFNGELQNAVLCIVEETNLNKNKEAYDRIKDWVTSREFSIHVKNKTPYHTMNTTHWIQCANDINYCPKFQGDTRITMIHVGPIQTMIKRNKLEEMLEMEASDFLSEILNLEIPDSNDRLAVPIIETEEKIQMSKDNDSEVKRFIDEKCFHVFGETMLFADFYARFSAETGCEDSKIKVGREIPVDKFPKGRKRNDPRHFIGNISFEPKPHGPNKIVSKDGFLDSSPRT